MIEHEKHADKLIAAVKFLLDTVEDGELTERNENHLRNIIEEAFRHGYEVALNNDFEMKAPIRKIEE